MARVKEKIVKELNKRCVVCNGKQCIIEYTITKRGVDHTEEFIECLSCGAKRKIKEDHGKAKESLDYMWDESDVGR